MRTAWILRMAGRDFRHSWRRLVLYFLVVAVGAAAVISVRLFSGSLDAAVQEESKTLLGADVALSSSQPFPEEIERVIRESPSQWAQEVDFSSMAVFPPSGMSRLVQVRALQGDYPFYGSLETDPPAAANGWQEDRLALVDQTLLLQFSLEMGDRVRIGNAEFRIAGAVVRVAGEAAVVSELFPRVFIPLRFVHETGLIQVGSRVRYRYFGKLRDPAAELPVLRGAAENMNIRFTTIEDRRASFGRSFRNLNRFLGLAGLVALVLAAAAVSSAVLLSARRQAPVVATLRCLGCRGWEAVLVFVFQIGGLSLGGLAVGAVAGVAAQSILPWLLQDWLPFTVQPRLRWQPVVEAVALCLGGALFFALVPAVPLRRVPPLAALRREVEPSQEWPAGYWVLEIAALGGLVAWSRQVTGDALLAFGFVGGLTAVMLSAWGVSFALMRAARALARRRFSYEWRQGIANLYRPGNQTLLMVSMVALGTFLVALLSLLEAGLLAEIRFNDSEDRPNLVLFDVQTDELEGVSRLAGEAGMRLLQQVPVVTMRLLSVEGVNVDDIEKNGQERWAYEHEYRCTYREKLDDSERLVRGRVQHRRGDRVYVTLEEEIARSLRVEVGSRLTFDVQGVPVSVEVGGIRQVEWRSFQPNFFVVFPSGVLEDAPQFHVLVGRVADRATSAEVQRKVLERYPTVSAVDLSFVLETVEAVLDRVGFVVHFMGSFSLAVAFLTLVVALAGGRWARMREVILLRTLGASRGQLRRILLAEYAAVGMLGLFAGLLLAEIAGWGLCKWILEVPFVPFGRTTVLLAAFIPIATVLVGVSLSWGLLRRPVLEVLRMEN